MSASNSAPPWLHDDLISRRGWYRIKFEMAPGGGYCYVRYGLKEVMNNGYVPGLPLGPGYPDERFIFVTKAPVTLRIEAHGAAGGILIDVERFGDFRNFARLLDRARQQLLADPVNFPSRLRASLAYRLGMRSHAMIDVSVGLAAIPYQAWLKLYDKPDEAASSAATAINEEQPAGIYSALVLDPDGDSDLVDQTRNWLAKLIPRPSHIEVRNIDICCDSLAEQGLPGTHLRYTGSSNTSTADQLVVEAGVLPRPHAIGELAAALSPQGNQAAYADYDFKDGAGRRNSPVFGARFDRFHSAQAGLCGGMVLLRGRAVEEGLNLQNFPKSETIAGLLQHISQINGEGSIQHVPLILSHVLDRVKSERLTTLSGSKLTSARLTSVTTVNAGTPNAPAIAARTHKAGDVPQISVIIPSHDRIDLLSVAVRTLFLDPADDRLELIVVDHASSQSDTAMYLTHLAAKPRLQVVRADGPFNFSKLINLGAAAATGDLLCLANDDVEALDAGWIDAVLAAAAEPDVGAVGAKLLYPDGRVQHAGVAVGVHGLAVHAGMARAPDDLGPGGILSGTRTWSAVTAAFLTTPRERFEQVGGFDERLAIEFGDVDYCLRLAEAGYRSLCLSDIKLIHHESQSRGAPTRGPIFDQCQRDRALMQKLWARRLARDPWYPPNLNQSGTDLGLATPPLRQRPGSSYDVRITSKRGQS